MFTEFMYDSLGARCFKPPKDSIKGYPQGSRKHLTPVRSRSLGVSSKAVGGIKQRTCPWRLPGHRCRAEACIPITGTFSVPPVDAEPHSPAIYV